MSVADPTDVAKVSPSAEAGAEAHFQLRFDSLFHEGRGLAFPCDGGGRVRMDGLSARARDNYLYARAVVGREFAQPRVVPLR